MSDGVKRTRSPPHPALRDIDPATRFLYTPKTVSVLVIGACCWAQQQLVRHFPCVSSTVQQCVQQSVCAFRCAGVCTLVFLSGALNPTPRPDNPQDADKTGYYNKKAGLAAVAATYLCKAFLPPVPVLAQAHFTYNVYRRSMLTCDADTYAKIACVNKTSC